MLKYSILERMKLVANVKLLPTPEQFETLKETLERSNAACNSISETAWNTQTFGQFHLHKQAYFAVKEAFGLSSQMVVRCIAKVADAYKLDTKTQRHFRPHAAQPYDNRIFRFLDDNTVSIWTVDGRLKIAVTAGDRQRQLLKFRKGEVDLMLVNGKFYVACVCDVDDPDLIKAIGIKGIDLGIVNLATDSDGKHYSGESVEKARRIHAHRRRNLQRKRTRAAKRKLRDLKGKQARFQKNTNHCISKAIVVDAQRSCCAIALEDLNGIRDRVKAKKRQRSRLANWSFYQLRQFIEYKAALLGIPVWFVDPRNTSRECPVCHHTDKANRPTQAKFQCVCCGFAGPADAVAALNISARAAINLPNGSQTKVAHVEGHGFSECSYKPPLQREAFSGR